MRKGKATLTPLEQAIAVTTDRRLRYDEKMKKAGNRKLTVWVPEANADLMRQLAKALCDTVEPEAVNAAIGEALTVASVGRPL